MVGAVREKVYWKLDGEKKQNWECPNEIGIEEYTRMCESRISVGAKEKLPGWEQPHANTDAWSHDMEGHAQK